jgi:hypothetical protein
MPFRIGFTDEIKVFLVQMCLLLLSLCPSTFFVIPLAFPFLVVEFFILIIYDEAFSDLFYYQRRCHEDDS